MKVKLLSRVQLFATPWTAACQASSFLGFSRQEYWSGLPFPSPEDLPGPGIKPGSPALQADAFPSEPPGKPIRLLKDHNMQHASKNQHVNKRNFHSSMHSLMNHFFKKQSLSQVSSLYRPHESYTLTLVQFSMKVCLSATPFLFTTQNTSSSFISLMNSNRRKQPAHPHLWKFLYVIGFKHLV